MTILEGVLLIAAGTFTGFVNSIAGGGSLITMPLLIFMGLPSAEANGSNRVAIFIQNIFSTAGYRSKGVFVFPFALWVAIPACLGALIGSKIAVDIQDQLFNRILAVVMLMVMGITIFKPNLDQQAQLLLSTKKIWLSAVIFFGIGIYGGFIQAGVGFLIIAALTTVHGFDMARTNSIKVFVILCYTLVALVMFYVNEKIRWEYGLILAIGNATGGWLGSRWSVGKSDRLIRLILLVMVVGLSVNCGSFNYHALGVVIKQSFWGTLIAYVGVAVGYVNMLYLRPEFLNLSQIGIFTLITANAMMISPLASLGLNASYIRFFPSFKEENRSEFFTALLLLTLVGNVVIVAIGYSLRDLIAARYEGTAPEYINFLFVTAIIVVVNSLFDLFLSYSHTILKVIFPSFLRDVFLRLGAIVAVIGYAVGLLSFGGAIIGLGVTYCLALLFLFLQLMFVHHLRFRLNFSVMDREWRSRLFNFSSYAMLMAGSFAIMNNTTFDQVTAIAGSEANGIFITCFFMAVIVEMPRRNMGKVVGPIISAASEKRDMEQIKNVYQRSSITLAIIGSLLFIEIATNLNDLFSFIPKGEEFAAGFWVVIAVCGAKLVTMACGFPGAIIGFSSYYRFNLIFQIAAAVGLIVLNALFIRSWGLNGAAMSYFLIVSGHMMMMVLFVRLKFKMSPFSLKHIMLILVSVASYGVAYIFTTDLHPVLSILLRALLTTAVFVLLVYVLKISNDVNNLIDLVLRRVVSAVRNSK